MLRGRHRRLNYGRDEVLPEQDRVTLHDSTAHDTWRILLPRPHPIENLAHRSAVVAVPAARPQRGGVHLDHIARIVPRLLVQSVDVLRDYRQQLAATIQFEDCPMPRIRFGHEYRRTQSVPPRRAAHLRVSEVVLQRRRLLGRRVARPHTVRSAEVRNA